jgi:hypothetical protein
MRNYWLERRELNDRLSVILDALGIPERPDDWTPGPAKPRTEFARNCARMERLAEAMAIVDEQIAIARGGFGKGKK